MTEESYDRSDGLNHGLMFLLSCYEKLMNMEIVTGGDIVKLQPPDGFVVQLSDGGRWAVMARRQVAHG